MSKPKGQQDVFLGKSEVLAGVKVETGEPFPDTPNEGVMTVNAELVPIASPNFEPGPPNEDSIELARVVDRGIENQTQLTMKNLH